MIMIAEGWTEVQLVTGMQGPSAAASSCDICDFAALMIRQTNTTSTQGVSGIC